MTTYRSVAASLAHDKASASPACPACGYIQRPGEDWGHLDGATGPGAECEHLNGERECVSCSSRWYRVGFQSTHDYELVGDPPRWRGGPAKETCPECGEAIAAEATAERAPRSSTSR